MALRARHASERASHPGWNCKNQHHLEKTRKGSWIFKRMSAVGVEESAPICTEFLNHFLRRDRALRNDLLSHRLCGGLTIRPGDLCCVRLDQIGSRIRSKILYDTL